MGQKVSDAQEGEGKESSGENLEEKVGWKAISRENEIEVQRRLVVSGKKEVNAFCFRCKKKKGTL